MDKMSPMYDGGPPVKFDHPFVMAGFMFMGECACLLVYRASTACKPASDGHARSAARSTKQLPMFAFALPAWCDLAGTSIMYAGLTLTTASTYQMLRGSAIIFTGILSAVYLQRKQYAYHWAAIGLVVAGVVIVGVASTQQAATTSASNGGSAMLGNALVVLSQLFTALQMCLEERFVTGCARHVPLPRRRQSSSSPPASPRFERRRHSSRRTSRPALRAPRLAAPRRGRRAPPPVPPPAAHARLRRLSYNLPALVAVGNEGVWGLVGIVGLLLGLQHLYLNGHPVEDSVGAWHQVAAHPAILVLTFGNSLSISFFNFFGMSITKTSSAAYRMVLDSLRTLSIWLFELGLGTAQFSWLQVLGFTCMLAGTTVYNEAVRLPGFHYPTAAEKAEERASRARAKEREASLLSQEHKVVRISPQASPVFTGGHATSPLTTERFFTPTLSRYTVQHGGK